jgi:hypothetical protein
MPLATIMSTPASASSLASSAVVTVPSVTMPARRQRSSASAPGTPKMKLNTGGASSSTVSSCSSYLGPKRCGRSGSGTRSSSNHGRSSSMPVCHCASVSRGSSLSPSGIHRLSAKLRCVRARIFAATSRMPAPSRWCTPKLPSPPLSLTAATRSTDDRPLPNGPWMMGASRCRRRVMSLSGGIRARVDSTHPIDKYPPFGTCCCPGGP